MQLMERDEQKAKLLSIFEWVSSGNGYVVVIAGEAGIGKTVLVKRFLDGVQAQAAIFSGMCDDLYTPQALAPFYDIAFQIGGELVQMLPEANNLRLIGHTLLSAVQRQSEPVIMVVEDIHWADEATLDLLLFLSRRIEHLPIMLVLTLRQNGVLPNQQTHTLLGSLPAAYTERIRLSPLSLDAVRELLAADNRLDAETVFQLTHGNPFYVTELLASTEDELPQSVRDAVLARATRLSENAQRVLRAVSIVPNHAETWLVADIVDMTNDTLNEVLSSGMLTMRDGFLAFRHELARRAVAEMLPIATTRELHRTIFRALQAHQQEGITPARLVHHAAYADLGEAVVELAPQAARQASAVSAYREAAAHYATALRYKDLLSLEVQTDLLQARAEACYMGVNWYVALSTYKQALVLQRQLGNPERISDILCRMSRLAWGTVQGREARRYALQAVRTVRKLADSPTKALAYSTLAQWHMFYSNQRATLYWGEKALTVAKAHGADEVYIHTLTTIGTILAKNVGDTSGLTLLEESLQRALHINSQDQAGRAYVNLSIVAVEMNQPERALHYTYQGLQYTDDYDLNTYHVYLYCIHGLALLRQGEWAEAERVSRLGLDKLVAYVYMNRANLNCYMALGCLAARRGEPEAQTIAQRLTEIDNELVEMPDEAGFIHLTLAEIAWYHGDPAACTAEARALLDIIGNRPHAWYRGQALYWLWRCGEPVDSTEDIAEPYRLQIEGDWRGAAATWEQRGCPYEQAMALADGDEAALREAFAILDKLGAHAAMDYVRRRLRDLGAESVPRGMNTTTRENVAGLTRRQSEVLTLLKQDLTNAEIAARLHISPKTVEHHISAILARLEVATREEAIRVARSLNEKN